MRDRDLGAAPEVAVRTPGIKRKVEVAILGGPGRNTYAPGNGPEVAGGKLKIL